jgi:hypothetical protein
MARPWEHGPVAAADTLVRLRLLGFAGATALAAGSLSAGVYPRPDPVANAPVLGVLRATPSLGDLLAVTGMALLVVAWWRAARTLPSARWTVTTVALWALPLALAPPLFSRDVYSYAAQGDVYAQGMDPYAGGPASMPSQWLGSVSTAWWDTPAPYGPLFLMLARLAAQLSGGHLWVALLLLRVVAVAGVALIAVYLPRLARGCGVDERAAVWLGLGSPLLLAHFVSGAHNDALMLGLLVAGLAYAVEGRGHHAAVLIGLAAAVKAPALVALPFVALLVWPALPRWRALLRTFAVAVAAFGVVSTVAGLGLGWVGALRTPGASVQWTSLPTGLGLAAGWVLEETGTGSAAAALTVTRTLGMLVTLVVLAAAWWRVRNAGPRAVVAAFGWGLVAMVVLAAAFHPWYALWPVVVLAASTVADRVRRWLAVVATGLSFLLLPDGYNLARSTVLAGILLDVAVTVAGVVWAVRWAVRRRERPPAKIVT